MPRYSINLDPFQRPASPASDALTNAVAQVATAIERRRMMESEREERDLVRAERKQERDYDRERQSRLDALSLEDRTHRREMDDRRLTLEDEDRRIRADDRQLRIERDAAQDQRQSDRDAIDLFKMNEDLEYRDVQAAERQIQNMNIEDARREAAEARRQPRTMSFKEARALALDEAKARTGRDALGNARPVDPALVDELTAQFLGEAEEAPRRGGLPPPGSRGNVAPAARPVLDILDGGQPVAGDPQPAPAPAPAAPAKEGSGVMSRVTDALARGAMLSNPITALYDYLTPDQPAAKEPVAAPAQASPNMVDPDPQYIDQMEQLSQANPENFKQILRELKTKHPEEYAATIRLLSQRAAGAGSVASAQ